MDRDELKKNTSQIAELYFKDFPDDRPFPMWSSFDKDLAKDLILFITGRMYSREKLDHPTRQMVAVAALAALGSPDELRMHLWAARNVGCPARDLAEAIFQVGIYAGITQVNQALKVLRQVLQERGEWPLTEN